MQQPALSSKRDYRNNYKQNYNQKNMKVNRSISGAQAAQTAGCFH
jgi:hypothetical protein